MSSPRSWYGPLLVAAAGVAMLLFTWGTWADPIVDFGKEVYIAWQLSQGKRLYLDVAYHLGPLSPYVNALAFKVFGPSLLTIELLNICLLALMVALSYRLVRRIAGELAAIAAGLTFVCLFAFTHFTPIADYNFVCPYDHAHTHGILLGLLGLTFADHFNRTSRRWALAAAGATIGLAFLTRAELFLADAGGTLSILFFTPSSPHPLAPPFKSKRLILITSIFAPILLAWALLAAMLPAQLALGGLLGSWPIVFDRSVSNNPFYRESMGTLDFATSLSRLGRWTLFWLLIFLPPLMAGRFKTQKAFWTIAALFWGCAAAWFIGHFQDPADAFAPLPLALAACLILLKHRGKNPLALGALVWAILLLGKIVLNARIYHYGFALAMPATLLTVAIGVGWTPNYVRAAVLGALAITTFAYLRFAYKLMLVPDDRQVFTAQAINWLDENHSAGQTLAAVPEGAMINFLTNMPNPTPYWSFNPPYAFFAPGQGEAPGERKMLDALSSHPPDWIVLVNEDLSDFGTPFFGRDYGLSLSQFIDSHYSPRYQVGAPRFTDSFGVIILQRVYNASSRKAGEPYGATPG